MKEIKLSLLADDTNYLHRKSQGIYAQHRYRLVGELNKNTATSQQNNCKYLGWTIEKQN